MSRPIPLEVVPSHIHLSDADHTALFGVGHAGTVSVPLSQNGQFAYEETLEVFGKFKRSLPLRVLGPQRVHTQVELTPTEAAFLGIDAQEARSGDLSRGAACRLKGPAGEVMADVAVIIPRPHLHMSDHDAQTLRLRNGSEVSVDILGDRPRVLEHVVVRVHPTYRLRLHIHPDLARVHWLTGVQHVRVRELQH